MFFYYKEQYIQSSILLYKCFINNKLILKFLLHSKTHKKKLPINTLHPHKKAFNKDNKKIELYKKVFIREKLKVLMVLRGHLGGPVSIS